MNETYYAFIFGIIGTVLFHVGKSMQKQGIGILRIFGKRIFIHDAKIKLIRSDFSSGILYLIGIILNNSMAIWIMLANMFAPSSYFTSMFGTGLIALMIYSQLFLKENITPRKWIGMLMVVLGTFLQGIEGIHRVRLSMSEINIMTVLIIISIYIAGSILFMIITHRSGNLDRIGLATGFFTGGLASMDPVLKGIGQNYGGTSGFFPSVPTGWIIFIISFLFSTVSFVIAQWGFVKNTPVSIQVSTSTSVYICFPILLIGLSLPGYHITPFTIAGMIFVVGGILLISGFEKSRMEFVESE